MSEPYKCNCCSSEAIECITNCNNIDILDPACLCVLCIRIASAELRFILMHFPVNKYTMRKRGDYRTPSRWFIWIIYGQPLHVLHYMANTY